MALAFLMVDGPSVPSDPREKRAVVKLTPSNTGWRLSLRWGGTGRTILRMLGDEPRTLVETMMLWCSMNQISWVPDRESVSPDRVLNEAPPTTPLYPPEVIRIAAEKLLENLPGVQQAQADPRAALRRQLAPPPPEAPAEAARPVQPAQEPRRAPRPEPGQARQAPRVQAAEQRQATEEAPKKPKEDAEFERFLVQVARAKKGGASVGQLMQAMHAYTSERLDLEPDEADEDEDEALDEELLEEEDEEEVESGPQGVTVAMAPGVSASIPMRSQVVLRPARLEELPPEVAAFHDPAAEEKMRRTVLGATQAIEHARRVGAPRLAEAEAADVDDEDDGGDIEEREPDVVIKRSVEETVSEVEAHRGRLELLREQYARQNDRALRQAAEQDAGTQEPEAKAKKGRRKKQPA